MKNILIITLLLTSTMWGQAFLSNLDATKDDALFTTYAAPMERSEYKLDQGYHFMWYNQMKGADFETSTSGNIGLAFRMNEVFRSTLEEYYQEPVVTCSYSDIVSFYYYPFRNVRVDVTFDVYSSSTAIQEVTITNENPHEVALSVFPYIYDENENMESVAYDSTKNGFVYEHVRKRDGWMEHHNIPLVEDQRTLFVMNEAPSAYGGYTMLRDTSASAMITGLSNGEALNNSVEGNPFVLSLEKEMKLSPDASGTFRIVRTIQPVEKNVAELSEQADVAFDVDLAEVVKSTESVYAKIPEMKNIDRDMQHMYWSCFSLIRQCMMPPEGESSYNYYVFSREPKWGWGYGGQVFHESLVMLAYAFMDPMSAMNSQRVYMERQWDSGYINYRTGPYLNEQIEHEGQYTSSAPWYNYQNLEVYKITKDKEFLEEAFESGKQFYEYYTSNRDADNDGLCEWGAHAVLECVRDARVAVWDSVGWPSNFEGPDINAMLISEANALSEMAGILGHDDDMKKYKADAEARTELLQTQLWDDETGFFYNVDKNTQEFSFDGKSLKIKEIIGFLPIWAKAATKDQVAKLVEHMTNPEEFWRPYGVPTLTAKHPYYNPIGYWNGPIWVQWEYLLFQGLLEYGYKDVAEELTYKVLDNVINQLKTDHWFWEFYSADDYQAGWNKTYIWTGIVARMLIDLQNEGMLD